MIVMRHARAGGVLRRYVHNARGQAAPSASAREWIDSWRESQQAQRTPGGADHSASAREWIESWRESQQAPVIPVPGEQDATAREWIDSWRASQQPSRAQLWKMCIKLPMYTVAVAPMVVGTALAYFVTGAFASQVCKDLLLGGIFVIAWLNIRCRSGKDVTRWPRHT